MSRVVALGEQASVAGLGLGGAEVVVAGSAEETRRAWAALGEDVAVVILTPTAAAALADEPCPPRRLQVVMPACHRP